MRTTLDIEDDVLQAAKELARRKKSTTGREISSLARKALNGTVGNSGKKFIYRNGIPQLPSRGEIITVEHIQKIMDDEGI
ncbi:MAG: hypothetical protein ACRD6X_21830 [Pyrinomonadaceae bacterium]